MEMRQRQKFGSLPAKWTDETVREPRTRRLLKAQLMSPRFGCASIVVRNISACGLGGNSDEVLYQGEEVAALLANIGAIDGVIIWVKGGAFGLQFRQTIDPKDALATQTERIVKPYEVPAFFRPASSTYRPGFSRK